MSLKVSHILTVYTLERGSLPFCGCSLEPDVEALPRMEACVRGVWLGRPPSQPAPPHGMPMLPAACRTSEAPRHECPNSLCQPFHAWGRGANTRSGTYCWEQVQQPRHNPRSRMKDQGLHCSSGPGALGTFSDPHLPDTCCRATGFTPETAWAALTKEGALVTPCQGPGPPLTAHSTAVNRLC